MCIVAAYHPSKRLLVVEDNQAIQRAVKRAAESAGYDVIQAFDGRSGADFAVVMKPDIILLDVSLPELDGRDLLSRLKRNAATADIPVVIYSGRGEQHDRLLGLELGAVEYVAKPVDAQQIVLTLNSVLRRSQA